VTKEDLACIWNIPLQTAAKTIQVTTQKGIHMSVHPLHARYRTKQAHLQYDQLGGRHGRFYTDTMFANIKSTRGNDMAQIYVNDINFTRLFPIRAKSEVGDTLLGFIRDVGIPSEIVSDYAKETMGAKFKTVGDDHQIPRNVTEPYSPWQNRAESEVKRAVRRVMQRANSPQRLWDYCAVHQAELHCLTATDLYHLHGRTPYEIVTGNTPDISEYCQYWWYEPIHYLEQINAFPQDKLTLGRWLGVAHQVGQALCYFVLTETGQVIARTTVQPIPKEILETNQIKQQLIDFDRKIVERLGPPGFLADTVPHPSSPGMTDVDLYEDPHFEPWEMEATMPEADDLPPEFLDEYISAHVLLPKGGSFVKGQVNARKRDADGNTRDTANANPILDSRVCEVQFPDGHTEEYAANIIAEAIYAQVDDEGHEHLLLLKNMLQM